MPYSATCCNKPVSASDKADPTKATELLIPMFFISFSVAFLSSAAVALIGNLLIALPVNVLTNAVPFKAPFKPTFSKIPLTIPIGALTIIFSISDKSFRSGSFIISWSSASVTIAPIRTGDAGPPNIAGVDSASPNSPLWTIFPSLSILLIYSSVTSVSPRSFVNIPLRLSFGLNGSTFLPSYSPYLMVFKILSHSSPMT